MAPGAGGERPERPWCRRPQMRDYIAALEQHVTEVQRQANRMVKRQAVMGSSLNNFGRSMVALGKCACAAPVASQGSDQGSEPTFLRRRAPV